MHIILKIKVPHTLQVILLLMFILMHQLTACMLIRINSPYAIKLCLQYQYHTLQRDILFDAILYMSITDLTLINFEWLRIQWNAITINDNNRVRNEHIDRNHTIIQDTLYTANSTQLQNSNLFMNHTCIINKNTALYSIDLSSTNETLKNASVPQRIEIDKFQSYNTKLKSFSYLVNITRL